MFRCASWLLMIVGCTLVFAGHGCGSRTKASSPDAAADASVSTGGTASGGVLGKGGGSAGNSARDSGGAVGGGAGGSGGSVPAGGVMGSGGAAGFGGTASTGGATGYGGVRDGGDADSRGAIGTDGSGSLDGGPDGGSELRCVETASPICPVGLMCNTVPGCYMSPYSGFNHCLGSPASCSSNSTSTTCEANPGCVWLPPGSCSGTPSPCDKRSLAADCAGQPGCTWTPPPDGGTCFATPDPCSENFSQAACSAQMGCTWSNAVCITASNACLGKVNLGTCLAVQGCDWGTVSGSCSGIPGACSVNATSAACEAAGCSWYGAAACTGTARPCTDYTPYDVCVAVSGCSWGQDNPNCWGTPTPCSQLSVATCASQAGCTVSTP